MKTLRFVFLLAMPILLWAGSATTSQDMGFRHMVVPRQQARAATFVFHSAPFKTLERGLDAKGGTLFCRRSLRCAHIGSQQ